MVDVGDKPVTGRRAAARAVVAMTPATAQLLADERLPKGDVLAVARVAGIMAAKRTSGLIPLCHPIALSSVRVDLRVDAGAGRVDVTAETATHDRTGVEMEAMTAASVAALTVYDMVKGVERGVRIQSVELVEKDGGRSGHWTRVESSSPQQSEPQRTEPQRTESEDAE
jgi:cyclic pyranopterin phosphate synthase